MTAVQHPKRFRISTGRPQPLGATVDATGVNFSVYSEYATSISLLLFSDDAPAPDREIVLNSDVNKSFHFWHVHVEGVGPGQLYAYRVGGPHDVSFSGCRFNPNKALIDPYALGNVNTLWLRADALGPGDNVGTSMRSVVIDPSDYDWEGDEPLHTPLTDTVIYEIHVKGFTCSPTSGVAHPGTFDGITEKIPYLRSLGITAVELMPIFDYDEQDVVRYGPDGTPYHNYWGYDPYSHFAPQSSYCIEPSRGSHLREFRDMVKALHRAGIEVILDVVYNHTGEGNHNGPTISFRGFANEAFYHLAPHDKQYYMDYTGCGNTFNANHPVVMKYIVESLEYWVEEMHVDGFRFDLGSILSRGTDGAPMMVPPALWNIELSRVLSEIKVIAEAWDAGGLYQVGRFPGKRWSQWNGPYRDQVRSFVKGDPGLVGDIATSLGGSSNLFGDALPTNSINFITCHDGFTMNDLVSYNFKHNEANGEYNRDGNDDNRSWNCGAEGISDDATIEELRERQIKNFATLLFLSRGVPMFLGGDECRQTQLGNNNAYCQDNETSWFDWDLVAANADLLRFFSSMISFRRRFSTLRRPSFFGNRVNSRGVPEITWHGCQLQNPGWGDPASRVLALTLGGLDGERDLHVIFNMHHLTLPFELPEIPNCRWLRSVDTAIPSPDDIVDPGHETVVDDIAYWATGRSVVILTSQDRSEG